MLSKYTHFICSIQSLFLVNEVNITSKNRWMRACLQSEGHKRIKML